MYNVYTYLIYTIYFLFDPKNNILYKVNAMYVTMGSNIFFPDFWSDDVTD